VLLARRQAEPVTEGAHASWERVLRLNPSFAPAQVNVALRLESRGRLEEAVALYRQAVGTRPDLPAAHFNLGNALLKERHDGEAEASFRETLRLVPDHAGAHRNLSLILERLGQPCSALEHLERSRTLDTTPDARSRVGRELGRLRAACDSEPR
jgi:tetratricopeptide (TPR) repeat protein